MRVKIAEYLSRSVPMVVIVDPDERTVTVHRRAQTATTLREAGEVLDLDEVIPGFRCQLQEIFR